MKRLMLLLAALCCLTAGWCQNGKTADYQSQYAKLYKAYTKNPEDPAVLENMARFYSAADNPMLDYAAAMRNITTAEERYVAMLEDNKHFKRVNKLIKKGVTLITIRAVKQDIIDATSLWLSDTTTIAESSLDQLAEAFAGQEEVTRLVAEHRFEQHYRKTLKQNTLEAYRAFMETYPNTNQAERAEAAMGRCAADMVATTTAESAVDQRLGKYYDIPAVKMAATKRKSAIAFDNLKKQPSMAACQAFLSQYPGSEEYMEVLTMMEEMANNEFDNITDAEGYAHFVLSNPDNALADDAMDELKRLITEEHDQQAAKVYLKNFPLDVNYNDIYLQYYKWHTEEGNMAPLEKFENENPDFPYYMALAEAKEAAAIYDQFDINMPFTESQFSAWVNKVQYLTGKKGSFVALQRTLQQYIAAGQWNKIPARIDYFALSFETDCLDEVAELRSIVGAPNTGRSRTLMVAPAYDMMHPVLQAGGEALYYDKFVDGKWQIWRAKHIVSKKAQWLATGPLYFTNMENSDLHIYSLFDGGAKMLLGRDGDIMVAEWRDSAWSWVETLPAPVNSAYQDYDAVMVADGSGILFASDRPDGHNLQPSRSYFHGDTALASDIYYVPYNKGRWGKAINLGINVNSPYMECSPVLSADKKTLYFITDGRGGLGYGDLYYTTRDNVDDWKHWAKPRNYGKETNTGFNEASVTMSGDNDKLLLCSNFRGRYGCYSLPTLEGNMEGFDMVQVVADEVGFNIDIIDSATQTTLILDQAVARQSEWRSSFYSDKGYLLVARCEGVFIPGIKFRPSQNKRLTPAVYTEDALLSLAAENRVLPMPVVQFKGQGSDLQTATKKELEQLADFLSRHPNLTVELVVSVDGTKDAACFKLSQERGKSIKKQLISNGIDADRIAVSAYGNSLTKRNKAVVPLALLFYAQ
ncbi:MAG: OmpA family protein [Bacteroidales bacterium]|nr:OmpA family protein [Bacteroidales bacterium]